jgi:hypothetical protein
LANKGLRGAALVLVAGVGLAAARGLVARLAVAVLGSGITAGTDFFFITAGPYLKARVVANNWKLGGCLSRSNVIFWLRLSPGLIALFLPVTSREMDRQICIRYWRAESANSLAQRIKPRYSQNQAMCALHWLAGTGFYGHTFNQFSPWAIDWTARMKKRSTTSADTKLAVAVAATLRPRRD